MHLHFILDEPQYNAIFEPLIEEARGRRHMVSTSMRWNTCYDADVYIGLQSAAAVACPRPQVAISHGLGLAKHSHFSQATDLLIFPSKTFHDIFQDRLARKGRQAKPVIAYDVGSSKIDLLQRQNARAAEIKAEVRAAYGFDDRPIVVFCPTFKHNGGLIHPQRNYRLRQAEELLERHYNVLVMHHSLESDKSEVQELRFRPVPGVPRLHHFIAADCAVSDISGISFELAAIDKPVVLVDNPEDPEFLRARMWEHDKVYIDFGPVCTLETMLDAVAATLADPGAYAAQRARWSDMAFGPRDGRSAARVIDAITDFILKHHHRFAHKPGEPELLRDYLAEKMAKLRSTGPLTYANGVATAPLDPAGRSVLSGPYQRLGAGIFELDVDIEVTAPGEFVFQIDSQRASRILARHAFEGRLAQRIRFEMPADLSGQSLEYRLRQPKGAEGIVTYRRMALSFVELPRPEAAAPQAAAPVAAAPAAVPAQVV